MCTTGDEIMGPSSWKSYLDDFPFFGSSLAHLEPKFKVDDHGNAGNDDLSHHSLPNFLTLATRSSKGEPL